MPAAIVLVSSKVPIKKLIKPLQTYSSHAGWDFSKEPLPDGFLGKDFQLILHYNVSPSTLCSPHCSTHSTASTALLLYASNYQDALIRLSAYYILLLPTELDSIIMYCIQLGIPNPPLCLCTVALMPDTLINVQLYVSCQYLCTCLYLPAAKVLHIHADKHTPKHPY